MLEAFAKDHERAHFWAMPGSTMKPHGEVLDALYAIETSEFFCFMDSDIVASGPFFENFQASLDLAPAVFSGAPVWLAEGDGVFQPGFRLLAGEYIWDSENVCLGCTYIAAYDRSKLDTVIRNFGLQFREYRWESLTEEVQEELVSRGKKALIYDTGKVINALLPAPGRYLAQENLHHIGGFSFVPTRASERPKTHTVRGIPIPRPLRMAVRNLLTFLRFTRLGSIAEARTLFRRRVNFRDPVRRYFFELLRHTPVRSELPEAPVTGSALVNAEIAKATDAIIRNAECCDDSKGPGVTE